MIHVGVSIHKLLQDIAHRPRIKLQFEEEHIHRQIQGINHQILTLIHDPKWLPVIQPLRRTIITSCGVCDEELLFLTQTTCFQFCITRRRLSQVALLIGKSIFKDFIDALEILRIPIAGGMIKGHFTCQIISQHDPNRLTFPRLDIKDQTRDRRQQEIRSVRSHIQAFGNIEMGKFINEVLLASKAHLIARHCSLIRAAAGHRHPRSAVFQSEKCLPALVAVIPYA